MAEKKLFIVTDLGGGDGGKGGVVHKICAVKNAHTVVKVGGAQGSHGVRTARGESFNFSQFGCGAFEGVRTHISSLMVVDPPALIHEGHVLKYEHGLRNIFDTITIDEDALCVTPFHRIASQLRELARKDKPKGTVGTGVGEAVIDSELFPKLAIRVKDITKSHLRDMLADVREQKMRDLFPIVAAIGDFWEGDREYARELADALQNPAVVDSTAEVFGRMQHVVKIVDADYLKKNVLARDGTVVVECSHGILTDRYSGFYPHTTKLRTLPASIIRLVAQCGYDGDMVRLGVTRAYQIRHGAGPMVTECPDMIDTLLPGSNKDENRWQGRVRVGPLDFVALRYAIQACGGATVFGGIALTWFDQIITNGFWPVCDAYIGADDEEFFCGGEIRVRNGADEAQLSHQERLGNLLRTCRPHIFSYPICRYTKKEDLIRLCEDVCMQKLGIPVKMISFGPTEDEKVCI